MENQSKVLTPNFEIYSDENGTFEIEFCCECNKRVDIECECENVLEDESEDDSENDTRDEIECKYLDYIKSNKDEEDYEYEEIDSDEELKDEIDYIQNVDCSIFEEELNDEYDDDNDNFQIVHQHNRLKKEIIIIDN